MVAYIFGDRNGSNGLMEEGFYDGRFKNVVENFNVFDNNSTTNLSDMNELDTSIKNEQEFTVLLVYDSNCGHCTSFSPIWEKVADDYKSNENVNFFQIGDESPGLRDSVSKKFNVTGYPTIITCKDTPSEYQGNREYSVFKRYIETNL
jgi:thiol-disulfide isomerase/thioredoxin